MSDQTDTKALTPAQRTVLRSLAKRRDRIVRLRTEIQAQYDGRLDDLATARKIVPPVLVEDICVAAGITESAYRAILRNAKERQGENGKG
jgi:hypothetical protein